MRIATSTIYDNQTLSIDNLSAHISTAGLRAFVGYRAQRAVGRSWRSSLRISRFAIESAVTTQVRANLTNLNNLLSTTDSSLSNLDEHPAERAQPRDRGRDRIRSRPRSVRRSANKSISCSNKRSALRTRSTTASTSFREPTFRRVGSLVQGRRHAADRRGDRSENVVQQSRGAPGRPARADQRDAAASLQSQRGQRLAEHLRHAHSLARYARGNGSVDRRKFDAGQHERSSGATDDDARVTDRDEPADPSTPLAKDRRFQQPGIVRDRVVALADRHHVHLHDRQPVQRSSPRSTRTPSATGVIGDASTIKRSGSRSPMSANEPFSISNVARGRALATIANFTSAFLLSSTADVVTNLSTQLGDIDNALTVALARRGQIGATVQTVSALSVDRIFTRNADTQVQSNLEDADIAKGNLAVHADPDGPAGGLLNHDAARARKPLYLPPAH